MKIHSGLFDSMVLQRGNLNRSNAKIEGTTDVAAAAGDVVVRVSSKGKALTGFANKKIGRARGRFAVTLKGIPTGGPYDVELSIRNRTSVLDKLLVRNVLVGDVWIAGGQSNMQGCGRREHAAKPHPMVRAFYMDDRWDVAADPLHNMWDAVDQVHHDLNSNNRTPNLHQGVGPAVAFAQEMFRRTGVPQGILACAHGGTAMFQWDPALKSDGGKSLYGATVRRLQKNGGAVAGMIWYQGESDSATDERIANFTDRMKRFIAAVRRDTRSPRLPIAMVQISRVVSPASNFTGWNSVQEQQRLLAEQVPNVVIVPAIDLRLDDGIHIGTDDVNRLGRRLGQAMHALQYGKKAGKPPIRLRGTRFETDPIRGWADLIVEFDHVDGKLHCGDNGARPAGFSLSNGQTPAVYDVVLDTDSVRLRTNQPAAALTRDFQLQYGHGLMPMCNITDAADRALPVFGPVPLGKRRAFSPYVRAWQVTAPLPGAGTLDAVKYPADLDALPWRPLVSAGAFADVHPELAPLGWVDRLVYFRTTIDVPEEMKLAALLGYDGPVKLWLDGKPKPLFHDPAGTNPAFPDRATIPFRATKGKHEILVALGTNSNKAWGIFLRFERLGLSRKTLDTIPSTYAMPAVAET